MRKIVSFLQRFETKGGVAFEPGDEVVGVKRASFNYLYGDELFGYWSCFSHRLGRNVAVPYNRSNNLFELKETSLLTKS